MYNNDNYCVFQFHHSDRENKKFTISNKLSDGNWEEIKKEAEKCVLLCSNCHRKRHWVIREEFVVSKRK